MPSVVIAHGSFLQPAHYRRLVGRLRGAGLQVSVPDIGQRSLADATKVIQDAVDACPEAPLVIGHSYGGASAGAAVGAAHLLFLSAFVLDVGEPSLAVLERARPATSALESAFVMSPDGQMIALDPVQAPAALCDDASRDDAQQVVSLLRSEPFATFSGSPQRASWRCTPSTYLLCTLDNTWPGQIDRELAARCGAVVETPSGHLPFLTRTDDVVGLVERLVS